MERARSRPRFEQPGLGPRPQLLESFASASTANAGADARAEVMGRGFGWGSARAKPRNCHECVAVSAATSRVSVIMDPRSARACVRQSLVDGQLGPTPGANLRRTRRAQAARSLPFLRSRQTSAGTITVTFRHGARDVPASLGKTLPIRVARLEFATSRCPVWRPSPTRHEPQIVKESVLVIHGDAEVPTTLSSSCASKVSSTGSFSVTTS